MAATDYKFTGWLGLDKDSVNGKMVWKEFEPKPWEETDVDIKISHCGICGSDMHTLRSGWVRLSYSTLYISNITQCLTVSIGPYPLSLLCWPRDHRYCRAGGI